LRFADRTGFCRLNHWKQSAPIFAQETHVIAIELPGHGESDKPEATDYSIDLFANLKKNKLIK